MTTQHERDAETGLDYRGARYYDCDVASAKSLQRFLDVSEDLAKTLYDSRCSDGTVELSQDVTGIEIIQNAIADYKQNPQNYGPLERNYDCHESSLSLLLNESIDYEHEIEGWVLSTEHALLVLVVLLLAVVYKRSVKTTLEVKKYKIELTEKLEKANYAIADIRLIKTHRIVLKGGFIEALRFIYTLEKEFDFASLINVSFDYQKYPNDEREALYTTLLLQNYLR